MSDRITREVEGRLYVVSGTKVCPSRELCDVTPLGIKSPTEGPEYEAYVHRHCLDHDLGTFDTLEDAERNLGVWCFYFSHKFVWGNPEILPEPFYELHAFIADATWNEQDLEQRLPHEQRTYRLPDAADRRPGEERQMQQLEVPRQLQKTSMGARAHTVFEHLHEYFINGRGNYRTIIRSATGKNTRDTLSIIRRMATKSTKIRALYGIWMLKCRACTAVTPTHDRSLVACPTCGEEKKTQIRRISLVNETRGAGGLGTDMVSFRWLTDADDADAIAAYSVWVAGLETETTGQRPDRMKWDDPQTEKNSRTVEMRMKIHERFDDSVRQLQFGGKLLVLDTRKYVDDFAGKITKEPLVSLFYSMHRKVRWRTDEPDNAPYVVDGFRYYYPIKGTGERALDAKKVDQLERQMSERNFSAEYLNEPLDASKALFKREHFKVIPRAQAPVEVRYGLGSEMTPSEQNELSAFNVKIVAYNSCDPSGKEEQSTTGDDTFIVGLRTDRYGAVYITYLSAGKWPSSKVWDEIAKANAYNRPQFTDYEMPASELHVRSSFDKWTRERSEKLSVATGEPATFIVPIKWSHMPKSTKHSRIEVFEQWTSTGRFFILEDAASPELLEKYIGQWVGYLVSDHDDGPDATSRLSKWLIAQAYRKPVEEEAKTEVSVENGVARVPMSMIHELATQDEPGGLWGQRGGVNAA